MDSRGEKKKWEDEESKQGNKLLNYFYYEVFNRKKMGSSTVIRQSEYTLSSANHLVKMVNMPKVPLQQLTNY